MIRVKRKSVFVLIALILTTSIPVLADDISVLVVRTPSSTTSTLVAAALDELNDTMSKSGLGHLNFVSAKLAILGFPSWVNTTCTDVDRVKLHECIRDDTVVANAREMYSADIVIVLTKFLVEPENLLVGICGIVPRVMINPGIIGHRNEANAYAYIKESCQIAPDIFVVPHEVGHLLYIEHRNHDPQFGLPISLTELDSVFRNHAHATQDAKATVVSAPSDVNCANSANGCTFHQFFSDADRNFFGSLQARGVHGTSDAVDVITTNSWDVVSKYRPQSAPPQEECSFQFTPQCGEPFSGIISPIYSGTGTVTNIDIDFSQGGTGNWNDLYEGSQTCPGFMSNTYNLFRAIIETTQGITYCEAGYQFVYQPGGCGTGGGGIFD